jgi:hypothetical protein
MKKYCIPGTYIVELAGKFIYYQPDGTVLTRKVPQWRKLKVKRVARASKVTKWPRCAWNAKTHLKP